MGYTRHRPLSDPLLTTPLSREFRNIPEWKSEPQKALRNAEKLKLRKIGIPESKRLEWPSHFRTPLFYFFFCSSFLSKLWQLGHQLGNIVSVPFTITSFFIDFLS